MVNAIEKILCKERLRDLGFDVPVGGKITARQSIMLNRIEASTSDVAWMDDIELQEIMKNVATSMENLISQLEGEFSKDLPILELLGLDKQLRSTWGSLKVKVAEKVQLVKK